VLIFKPLLLAEVGVERRRYRCGPVVDGHDWILPARLASALYTPATADKARCNIGGKSLPRFSARRRIPAQAFAVK
jgi:hypothetical protein